MPPHMLHSFIVLINCLHSGFFIFSLSSNFSHCCTKIQSHSQTLNFVNKNQSFIGSVRCLPQSVCRRRRNKSHDSQRQIGSLLPRLQFWAALCTRELHPCHSVLSPVCRSSKGRGRVGGIIVGTSRFVSGKNVIPAFFCVMLIFDILL